MNLTGRRLRFSGAAMGVVLLGAGLVTSMNLGSAHADTTSSFHSLAFNLTEAAGSVWIVGTSADTSNLGNGKCVPGSFTVGLNTTPLEVVDGTSVTVESFSSPDCTKGLMETLTGTVSQPDGNAYFTLG